MLKVGQISVALALLLANPRKRLGYFAEEDLEMSKLQIMEFVKTKLESWEIKMEHNHGFLPFTCRCFRIWSMRSPTKSSCSVAKRVGLQQFPEPRKNMTDGDDFRKTEKNHLPRTNYFGLARLSSLLLLLLLLLLLFRTFFWFLPYLFLIQMPTYSLLRPTRRCLHGCKATDYSRQTMLSLHLKPHKPKLKPVAGKTSAQNSWAALSPEDESSAHIKLYIRCDSITRLRSPQCFCLSDLPGSFLLSAGFGFSASAAQSYALYIYIYMYWTVTCVLCRYATECMYTYIYSISHVYTCIYIYIHIQLYKGLIRFIDNVHVHR